MQEGEVKMSRKTNDVTYGRLSYLNENVRDLGDFVHEARFLSVCVLLVNIRRRRFYLNQPMSGQQNLN